MSQIKTLWLLLGMVLLIALPWVAAYWVVDHAEDLELTIQVSGELVSPVVDSNVLGWTDQQGKTVSLDDHWWLIAKSGFQREAWLQSMRYALGSDANRLRIAIVCGQGDCSNLKGEQGLDGVFWHTAELADQFPQLERAQAILIDPKARIVMTFPDIEQAKAIVKDIKHLFKASHIG